MIDDSLAFADAHFDVTLQLVEVFLRIDEMKIVPRVRPRDYHHKEVTTIIEIAIAHWRLELFPILFDPVVQINRRLHSGHDAERISLPAQRQTPVAAICEC